jgi:glucosyl-dolichyl phosphate glucuronosyltransferase
VVDRSPELQRRAEAELPGLRVSANTHRGGHSGARQTGADIARGSILAYLDDDAVADPQWLAELHAAHRDPNVLGAGGLVEPNWLQPPPSWFPREFNWVVGCTYDGMTQEPGPIRNPIGANMAVRAEVMRRTGAFATELGRTGVGTKMGSTAEETEFCIRAARLHPGGYWMYRPGARVRHVVPAQRGTWAYFVSRCRVEGRAKAVLAALTGTDTSLQSERAYVRSVLPKAFVRELRAALTGDPTGLARAGAIVAGLGITSLEYFRVRAQRGRQGAARAA